MSLIIKRFEVASMRFATISKKRVNYLILLVLIILLSSCGLVVPNIKSNQEDVIKTTVDTSYLTIVIDDGRICYEEHSKEVIEKISDVLSNSFAKIVVMRDYSSPKDNELIIRPNYKIKTYGKGIDDSKVHFNGEVDVTSVNNKHVLNIEGYGEYIQSLPERLAGTTVGIATLGLSAKGQGKMYNSIAFNKAISAVANNFHNALVISQILKEALSHAKLAQSLPSDLTLTASFSDASTFLPNNTLDASENTELIVKAKNTGKGAGYGTILEVGSNNTNIAFDKEITIGDIQPGEEKEIKVKLKAGLDLGDGKTTFQLNLKEKRGYDSKRLIMEIPTAALEKPELTVADYRIYDGNTGFASGNGNGIPENGETIEITPIIKNKGVGKAVRVAVYIASVNSGVEITEKSAVIPEILTGETASTKLAFRIPTTYAGGPINVRFEAQDARGNAVANANRQFALNTEVNRPVLAYSWRLLDKNGREKENLNNGEEGEIEIRPRNTGKLEARNVTVAVLSGVASFGKSSDSISRIAPESEYAPIRFPFTVPRAFEGNTMDVTVRLDQKDFSGLSDPRTIPVRLVRPEFKLSHQVLSPSGSNSLKQGESAEVVIRVDNTGQLDAEQVMLTLDMTRRGVLLKSAKEVTMGKIEAGKFF